MHFSRGVKWLGLTGSLSVLALACLETSSIAAPRHKPVHTGPTFNGDVLPMVAKYCTPCHSGAGAPAGLDFAKLRDSSTLTSKIDVWQKVLTRFSAGEMPPSGSPAPSAAVRKRVTAYLQNAINSQCKLADPGRVTLRRLNREEYNNTIRDLIGLDLKPADDFPSDDVGYGFDNIGDVRSMSPLLMEKYITGRPRRWLMRRSSFPGFTPSISMLPISRRARTLRLRKTEAASFSPMRRLRSR